MMKTPVLALPRPQQILKQIPVVPPAPDVVNGKATGTLPTDTTAPAAGKRRPPLSPPWMTEAGTSPSPFIPLPELAEALRRPRECVMISA